MKLYCKIFVGGLMILASFSCKKKTKTSGEGATNSSSESKIPALKMVHDNWPQEYWTAKAKININHPGMNVSFNMTLRAEKNKQIWFSANAFGLMEVARGLVDNDSIRVWDKFNNRCLTGDLSALQGYVPITLDQRQLQHFLMGRVFWDSLTGGKIEEKGDSSYLMGSQGGINFKANIWQKYLLHKAFATDPQFEVSLTNQNFKLISNILIPFEKSLQSNTTEDGKVQASSLKIEFTKFEFLNSKPDFSLELPADCQRQAIR